MIPHHDTGEAGEIRRYLNESFSEGITDLAKAFISESAEYAEVGQVFSDGLTVRAAEREVFVPFLLRKADIREQAHYLVFYTRVRRGALIDGGDYRYFTVTGSRKITPNIQRLTLQSRIPVPESEAGLAWYFTMKKMDAFPTAGGTSPLRQIWHRTVLRLLCYVKAGRRRKILDNFYKGKRYYTVRKTQKSSENQIFDDIAVVDVFLHGNTAGSRWAAGLRRGDIVRSTAQYREQTAHLASGKALLIGDETALPTVSALLEMWKNPIPPTVISITGDAADQAYLPNGILPEGTVIFRLTGRNDIPEAVAECLAQSGGIETAWGALEAGDAAGVRSFLKQKFGLSGGSVKIKGYWSRNKQT